MLFSCLTDADFLDTEAFMDPQRARERGTLPGLDRLIPPFLAYMERLAAGAKGPVNALRREVLAACTSRANEPPGLFSLTVPTGGGKTLASLAFALHHARVHRKRRIVYVIPYTSIIEQTAEVFRTVFAGLGEIVVEHHSNADPDPRRETLRTRLACENWDAPLIVTTSVQFFESLYAARTSRVRKLHNLCDSVVILDEAQLLPPEFRDTLCLSLQRLVDHYGMSLLLSTATQPALQARDDAFGRALPGLGGVREIVPDPIELSRLLCRVRIELPADLDRPVEWPALAAELATHPSVLCVVNRRDDCRTLHALMPEGTIHLSALMCGQHRAEVIAEIRRRCAAGEPVRVISTQLVEAGVDLDFPVVYRALAGLDSIAQAAGRCNREGRLPEPGSVKVFVSPSRNHGLIRRAEIATRAVLAGFDGDLLAPTTFGRYFEEFYARVEGDKRDIEALLQPGHGFAVPFRTVAELFRLIDDGFQQPVFVTYDRTAVGLLDRLRAEGPSRDLLRRLQRYSVNLTARCVERLLDDGFIEEIAPGLLAQIRPELYSPVFGIDCDARHDPGGRAEAACRRQMPGPIRRDCPLRANERMVFTAYTPSAPESQKKTRSIPASRVSCSPSAS